MVDGDRIQCDYCEDEADLVLRDVPIESGEGDLHLCDGCLELLFRKAMPEADMSRTRH